MTSAIHQSPRRRLAVAMIVRNEQELLAEALKSVRPIADAIYLLDTGSTDQTVSIARRMGASVAQAPWNNDFSAARNLLLEAVDADWILWLDACERLEPESARALRDFVDRQADPQKVYLLMVEMPSADPTASGEQVAVPRLVPHDPDLRYTGRVRETLQPAIEAIGLNVDAAPGRILRTPAHNDPERKAQRARRNLRLVDLEAAGSNEMPVRLLLAKGEAHAGLNDRAAAREAFGTAVRSSRHGSTDMLEAYYGLLTTFDGQADERDRQVAICLEALEVFPLDAQLLCAMGSYLQARGDVALATTAFDAAAKYGQLDLETWHLRELAEVTAVCLSVCCQLQGNDDQARRVLSEALVRHKHSVRIRRQLIDLEIKHGRCDEALAWLEGIPMEPKAREVLRQAVHGACKAAQENWLAALGYLQSAYVAGCHDPLCLRWLSVTLLSNGQTEAVRPILKEWQEMEPNNAEIHAYLDLLNQSEIAASPQANPPDDDSRWLRIDPGVTVLDALCPQMPIVSQASSIDL